MRRIQNECILADPDWEFVSENEIGIYDDGSSFFLLRLSKAMLHIYLAPARYASPCMYFIYWTDDIMH